MNREAQEVLERMATRGSLRGASVVFERAAQAQRHPNDARRPTRPRVVLAVFVAILAVAALSISLFAKVQSSDPSMLSTSGESTGSIDPAFYLLDDVPSDYTLVDAEIFRSAVRPSSGRTWMRIYRAPGPSYERLLQVSTTSDGASASPLPGSTSVFTEISIGSLTGQIAGTTIIVDLPCGSVTVRSRGFVQGELIQVARSLRCEPTGAAPASAAALTPPSPMETALDSATSLIASSWQLQYEARGEHLTMAGGQGTYNFVGHNYTNWDTVRVDPVPAVGTRRFFVVHNNGTPPIVLVQDPTSWAWISATGLSNEQLITLATQLRIVEQSEFAAVALPFVARHTTSPAEPTTR